MMLIALCTYFDSGVIQEVMYQDPSACHSCIVGSLHYGNQPTLAVEHRATAVPVAYAPRKIEAIFDNVPRYAGSLKW